MYDFSTDCNKKHLWSIDRGEFFFLFFPLIIVNGDNK